MSKDYSLQPSLQNIVKMEITNSKDQKYSSNYGTNIPCDISEVLKILTQKNVFIKFLIGKKVSGLIPKMSRNSG